VCGYIPLYPLRVLCCVVFSPFLSLRKR
jgi:hypothetical protein